MTPDRRDRPRPERGRLRRAGDPQHGRLLRPHPRRRPRLDRRDLGDPARASSASIRPSRCTAVAPCGRVPHAARAVRRHDTWVFGVDGDELYDPARLARFSRGTRSAAPTTASSRSPRTCSTASSSTPSGRRATGYLSPPSRSITKLYNFAAIDAWARRRVRASPRREDRLPDRVRRAARVDNIGERIPGTKRRCAVCMLAFSGARARDPATVGRPVRTTDPRGDAASGPQLARRSQAPATSAASAGRHPRGSARSTCAAISSRVDATPFFS